MSSSKTWTHDILFETVTLLTARLKTFLVIISYLNQMVIISDLNQRCYNTNEGTHWYIFNVQKDYDENM